MNRNSARIYDEFLVAAAKTGDRRALSRIVARWHPRLIRHAWRLIGDADRARDMAQEAWVEILRGLAGLDDVAAFPSWAYRIVTRRCQRSYGRLHAPLDGGTAVEELHDESGPHPGEQAAELATVQRAIDRLPASQRAVLALFYVDEMSVGEIAIACDIPAGTVKTRLMHARRRVRAILEGDDHGKGG